MTERESEQLEAEFMDRERRWTISELSKRLDLTPRSIRFYEDQKLISPDRENGRRSYNYRDVARLRLICRGKRLGFSLREIKQFLDLYNVDTNHTEQMKFLSRIADMQIDHLEKQLLDVQQMLSELREIRQQLDDHLDQAGAKSTAK